MERSIPVELDVEVTDQLFADLRRLAEERFGDGGETAVARTVSEALELWAEGRSLGLDEHAEWEEPVTRWAADTEDKAPNSEDFIRSWLFRRGSE